MARENYTFRAEPKPVKSRPKYRGQQDELQLSGLTNTNLMNDRRVVRGSTFARKPQPIVEPQPQRRARNVPQRPHPELPRVPTPEPVPGRVHCQVQTDNYLEDLREKLKEHDFGTQTDPELDYPEQPLFEPQSSGLDMYTYMEEGDLFDFDMEVEPVLHVITSKSIDQALLEVLEEEEVKDMLAHRQAYNQERNAQLAELQRLEAKDLRFEQEKSRRLAQAKERVRLQAELARKQAAATTAKDFYTELQAKLINTLAGAGFFFDPALKQVQSTFLPWLVKKVGAKLEEVNQARRGVDMIIDAAQQRVKIAKADKIFSDLDLAKVREAAGDDALPDGANEQSIRQEAFEYGEWDSHRRSHGVWGMPTQPIIYGLEATMDRAVLKEAKKLLDDAAKSATLGELPKVDANLGCTTAACSGAGVYVTEVVPRGAMSHASLCVGDVIMFVDGRPVDSPSEFEELEKSLELGAVVDVTVVRGFDGREEILKVEVFSADLEAFSPMQVRTSRVSMKLPARSSPVYKETDAKIALSQFQRHLGIVTNDGDLLTVEEVHENGPAKRAGVQSDDIITSVSCSGSEALDEPRKETLQAWLEQVAPGERVTVHLLRDGKVHQMDLEVAVAGETVERIRSLRLMAGLDVSRGQGMNDARLLEGDSEDGCDDDGEDGMLEARNELEAMEVKLGFVPVAWVDGVQLSEIDRSVLPLALSSLNNGDVITHVDEQVVSSPEELTELCTGKTVGDTLKIRCVRAFDGRLDILALELASQTANPNNVRLLRARAGLPVNEALLYTPEEAVEKIKDMPPRVGLRIHDKEGGVTVTEIHAHTTASVSSAQMGDLIHTVNGKEVANTADFLSALSDTQAGDSISFVAKRINPETQEHEDVTYESEMGVNDPQIRQELVWALRFVAGLKVFPN